MQLLCLCCCDSLAILEQSRKNRQIYQPNYPKWNFGHISIIGATKKEFFTLMADEVTDVSNREQVVICF